MASQKSIVVIGGGVAGSAVAYVLAKPGSEVTLLYRHPHEGSSFTNQKWNHSGLLYPNEEVASLLRDAFLKKSLLDDFVYPTEPTRFLALDKKTLEERIGWWEEWGVKSWGLDWHSLAPQEYRNVGRLATLAVGGFETPDRVLDFPALIDFLHREVSNREGTVLEGVDVSKLETRDGRVTAVMYNTDEGCKRLECSACVLAAGAWTNSILERSDIIPLPLILRKCVVFVYDGQLVPGITTCLDVGRVNGKLQDVTLVPFQGKTLAAGTGFTIINSGDDQVTDEVKRSNELSEQLVRCFPDLSDFSPTIEECVKTEWNPSTELPVETKSYVKPHIFTSAVHNVSGLVVAIPGKASFMFDLAEEVAKEIADSN